MRNEMAGGWRKLHNEEIHKLYFSSNIIRMIKSLKMRWAGHVPCMGEEECVMDLDGKVRRKEITRKTYVSGRTILRWIIDK
jgi:hypothetical protein